jgi:RNA polymerase-binding transcription factor DksA
MRRSQSGNHLSHECLDACRFKLTAALARLTTGSFNDEVHAAGRAAEVPVCESTTELALFCRRNLAANRMEWTSFLIRQVSEALERVDNGSYGLCVQCGQPIAARRVTALPWVELCTSCQEAQTGATNT